MNNSKTIDSIAEHLGIISIILESITHLSLGDNTLIKTTNNKCLSIEEANALLEIANAHLERAFDNLLNIQ